MQGLYDELIIADTGSTDKTIEIAKSYGARVEHFDWINDFGAARNYSFSFATGDFIVWCDADDILYPGDDIKLRNLILKYGSDPNVDGIHLPYIYSHVKIEENMMPDFKYHILRVVRNGTAKWKGRIHEYMEHSSFKTITLNDVEFHHYRDEERGTRNTARNLKILKEVVNSCTPEEKPRYLFYYGKECMYNSLWDDAINAFKEYIPISYWEPEKHRAHYETALCYKTLGNIPEAKKYALEAIQINENYVEPYILLGQIAYEEKRWKDVIKWMQASLNCTKPQVSFFDYIPYSTYIPHDNMSIAYYNLGQYQKGYEHLIRALSYKPNDPRLIGNKKFFEDKLKDFKYTTTK